MHRNTTMNGTVEAPLLSGVTVFSRSGSLPLFQVAFRKRSPMNSEPGAPPPPHA